MKKKAIFAGLCASLLLTCGACAACGSSSAWQKDWEKDSELKILMIGNSFSDDTSQYFGPIAEEMGLTKVKFGNLYIGGCSLQAHLINLKEDLPAYEYRVSDGGSWSTTPDYKSADAIRSENWDFISLQQVSGLSGVPESYDCLPELLSLIKEIANKDVHFVWNMTWAYQSGAYHQDFPRYNSDQKTMYNSILSTVKARIKPQKDFVCVVPCGTAIQNARTSYVGDTLTRDGYHLSYGLGRYTAALTFLKTVTGKSIKNVTFLPSRMSESERKVAIESAENAVKSPNKVTKSKYKKAP